MLRSADLTSCSTERGGVCHSACGCLAWKVSRAPAAAPVRSLIRTYNDFIQSNFIYRFYCSGEVILDNYGNKSDGPIIIFGSRGQYPWKTFLILTTYDTIEFVPGSVEYFYAYLFDPDAIGMRFAATHQSSLGRTDNRRKEILKRCPSPIM